MKTQEVTIEIVHYIAGFTSEIPNGLTEFMHLRSDLTELKQEIDPSLLPCSKSKAKKADWINTFISLPDLERRAITFRNPMVTALLPRDIKRLGLKTCASCGKKAFNPGKRIEFNVYGAIDVLSALTPKAEGNAA